MRVCKPKSALTSQVIFHNRSRPNSHIILKVDLPSNYYLAQNITLNLPVEADQSQYMADPAVFNQNYGFADGYIKSRWDGEDYTYGGEGVGPPSDAGKYAVQWTDVLMVGKNALITGNNKFFNPDIWNNQDAYYRVNGILYRSNVDFWTVTWKTLEPGAVDFTDAVIEQKAKLTQYNQLYPPDTLTVNALPKVKEVDGKTYILTPWYTTAGCQTKVDFTSSTRINQNVVFYAKYVEAKKLNVTVRVNGTAPTTGFDINLSIPSQTVGMIVPASGTNATMVTPQEYNLNLHDGDTASFWMPDGVNVTAQENATGYDHEWIWNGTFNSNTTAQVTMDTTGNLILVYRPISVPEPPRDTWFYGNLTVNGQTPISYGLGKGTAAGPTITAPPAPDPSLNYKDQAQTITYPTTYPDITYNGYTYTYTTRTSPGPLEYTVTWNNLTTGPITAGTNNFFTPDANPQWRMEGTINLIPRYTVTYKVKLPDQTSLITVKTEGVDENGKPVNPTDAELSNMHAPNSYTVTSTGAIYRRLGWFSDESLTHSVDPATVAVNGNVTYYTGYEPIMKPLRVENSITKGAMNPAPDKEFQYTLRLINYDGYKVTVPAGVTSAGPGVYTWNMGNGDTADFELPEGAKFQIEVTTTDLNMFTTSWTCNNGTPVSGNGTATGVQQMGSGTTAVTFTNQFTPAPPTDFDQGQTPWPYILALGALFLLMAGMFLRSGKGKRA